MKDNHVDHTNKHAKILDSVRSTKIIFPIIIGLAVVIYLLVNQVNMQELRAISWNWHAWFWVIMAVFIYVVRHLFNAWRLRILSQNAFSWLKSIELILIWEFSSAVSPSTIGGSAVALFFLAQEKISAARSVSIVIYTIVLDTIFTVVSLFALYVLLGPIMIRPGMTSISQLDGFGYTFIAVNSFMVLYGGIFFYGLFINHRPIQRIIQWISNFKLLRRWSSSLKQTAIDIEYSAKEYRNKPMSFHLSSFIATSGAWLTRFLAINCIIIALVPTISLSGYTQTLLLARGEVMHAITAFSPTPGGAGIAEIVFSGFYSDFITPGLGIVAAILWRLITYYPFLILGVIIIPNWFRRVLKK